MNRLTRCLSPLCEKKSALSVVRVTAVLLVFLSAGALPTLAGETAHGVIARSVDQVLDILKDPTLAGDAGREIKREKLWQIVDTVFDAPGLSRYALGRYWKTISPDQRTRFVTLYSLLLGRTYMDRILDYGDEKIVLGQEIALSDTAAEVRTTIFSQGKGIPVYYRLHLSQEQWKIFDVVIEGISLTRNYRSQFNTFLARHSMDKLLAALENKTRGARATP